MTTARTRRRSGLWPVPWAAIPFVVVAALPPIVVWDEWMLGFQADPIDWLLTWFLGVLPSLAMPLIGAAIVIRHRSAHRTVPLLLFGSILIAIQVAGVRLIEPVVRLFQDPGSFPDDPLFQVLEASANVLTLVGAFGWAYLASGLVRARRYEGVGPTAALVFVAIAVAVVTTAVQAGSQGIAIGLGTSSVVPNILAIAGLVVVFLDRLAIGYVAVTATRGWLAGEAPRRGWALAAVGAWLLLLAFVMIAAFPLLDPRLFESPNAVWLFRAVSIVFSAGSVALVAAFALGLPDTDDITWYDLAELDGSALDDPGADPFGDDGDDGDDRDDALDGAPALVEVSNRRLDR